MKKIKIKTVIDGFCSGENDKLCGKIPLYVQVTKDSRGATLSIEEYTISLDSLGLDIMKKSSEVGKK